MSLRDLSFWIGSARADNLLIRLRCEHGNATAFDKLYQELLDPWSTTIPHFRYQLLKYQKMLACLPGRQFERALDLGCGLGVMTRMLTAHAREILGVDLSPSAVASAEKLSMALPNVQFRQGDLLKLDPLAQPPFDLIAMADTIYYLPNLTNSALQTVCEKLLKMLAPGGVLLLANHYYFGLDGYSRKTRQIHDLFHAGSELHLIRERRHCFYLVSVFERNPRPA